MSETDLSYEIISRASRALKQGEPIRAGRGPFFDNELKRQLGIPAIHQSVLCARINLLVREGVLRWVDTGAVKVAGGGCATKEYPILELVPA